MKTAIFAAIFLFAFACYKPDLSDTCYTCTSANPICPDGTTCVSGYCQGPKVKHCDASTFADMSINPLVDMTIPPPPIQDLSTYPNGCANQIGYQLGLAWACIGAYSPTMKASSLCAAGWKICPNSSMVDLQACGNLTQYFNSNGFGYANMSYSSSQCTIGTGFQKPLPYGCGYRTGVIYNGLPCFGFTHNLRPTDAYWTAPDATNNLDQSTNTNANDGVLCCPTMPQG